MKIDLELNLRNLLCPMPVIKTQNVLKKMCLGEHLKIICTDPGVKHDIPTWCKINDYVIVEQFEQDDDFVFVIKA
ncbi:sulfurtransferase TusA family protein [Fastidiosibacter lacustris]|uniref:sulfurtransferase TusA family protein n=1 Tax=Fastidiosibacter lacustris TaxID=2056695 RepID=UPI000E3514DD|nr:sulfurtransferase TusA family protein [Fastidiosibacter lacustris]